MTTPSFRARLSLLSPGVRALLYMHWVFGLTWGLLSVFLQVFLYQKFGSISFNIFSNILFYTGCVFGFSVAGYIAAKKRLNIKYVFWISLSIAALSLVMLVTTTTAFFACTAMTLYGLADGLYWLGIHTFELTETTNDERDFYSSLLGAGGEIITLVGPALATACIFLSGTILRWGDFTVLFITTAVVCILGTRYLSALKDYYPSPIAKEDVRHFFLDSNNMRAQLWLMSTGIQDMVVTVVPPLVVLSIVGSPLNVGVYQTALGICTTLLLIAAAHWRTPDNRLLLLAITSTCLALAALWLGYTPTLVVLTAYTVVTALVSPLFSGASHVINLYTMETMARAESDFYPTMVFRDTMLWFWRSAAGILLLFLIGNTVTQAPLRTGMYALAASFVLTFFGAWALLRATQD